LARDALTEFSTRKASQADWDAFSSSLNYVPLTAGAGVLRAAVLEAERSFNVECRRLHYLSVPPNAALSAVRLLGEADLVDRGGFGFSDRGVSGFAARAILQPEGRYP
jgi:glucose-6-phosphate 1-dehydrogenase